MRGRGEDGNQHFVTVTKYWRQPEQEKFPVTDGVRGFSP